MKKMIVLNVILIFLVTVNILFSFTTITNTINLDWIKMHTDWTMDDVSKIRKDQIRHEMVLDRLQKHLLPSEMQIDIYGTLR